METGVLPEDQKIFPCKNLKKEVYYSIRLVS